MSYHAIYHTVPYRPMSTHTIPNHTIPSHAIPCRAVSCHTIPYHTTPCHIIPYHPMSYHTIPCHVVPCHAVPSEATVAKAEKGARGKECAYASQEKEEAQKKRRSEHEARRHDTKAAFWPDGSLTTRSTLAKRNKRGAWPERYVSHHGS